MGRWGSGLADDSNGSHGRLPLVLTLTAGVVYTCACRSCLGTTARIVDQLGKIRVLDFRQFDIMKTVRSKSLGRSILAKRTLTTEYEIKHLTKMMLHMANYYKIGRKKYYYHEIAEFKETEHERGLDELCDPGTNITYPQHDWLLLRKEVGQKQYIFCLNCWLFV